MRAQFATVTTTLLAALAAASPIDKRAKTCTVQPLRVSGLRTVDNGTGRHTVSFDFSFGTAEWSATLDGSCTLDAESGSETGACTPPGAATFTFDALTETLAVGVDFLCSPDSGIPQVVVFNGTIPTECAVAPGARACTQTGEFELPLVSQ